MFITSLIIVGRFVPIQTTSQYVQTSREQLGSEWFINWSGCPTRRNIVVRSRSRIDVKYGILI